MGGAHFGNAGETTSCVPSLTRALPEVTGWPRDDVSITDDANIDGTESPIPLRHFVWFHLRGPLQEQFPPDRRKSHDNVRRQVVC